MKQIAKLFRIIDNSPASNYVTINWFYDKEDVDMFEAGNRLNQIVKIHFDFVEN